MNKERFQQIWVSTRAWHIAEWLIFYYQIQPGHGLAPYLQCMSHIDNHNAVRLWVQQGLTRKPPEFQTLGDVRLAFATKLPFEKGDW